MYGSIVAGVVALLTSFFKGQGTSGVAGWSNGLLFYGAIAGGVYWFFNGAQAWTITLDGMQLTGAILGGSVLLEWFRKMQPPGV